MKSVNGIRGSLSILALISIVGVLIDPLCAAKRSKDFVPKYGSIVIDAQTGAVLHQDAADVQTPPASLTKIMTLYMLFEALEKRKIHAQQKFRVSKHASHQAPTKLHLKTGDFIRVKDAILALMTHSANDAAVAVAEALGGTEANFARLMTKKARQLGMRNTAFHNASGLPHKHQRTTARDMATLSRALYYHFPLYYRYFNTKLFTFRGRQYKNHNHLLGKVQGVDGIKTGFTCASGFNLAASATRGGRRLIGVVLGGKTGQWRDKHMTELLNTVFESASKGHHATPAPLQKPKVHLAVSQTVSHPEPLQEETKATHGPVLSEKGHWGIQVGAFSHVLTAQKAAADTRTKITLLENSEVFISTAHSRSRKLYCAKLLGLSERQAKQACQALKQIGQDCIALKP